MADFDDLRSVTDNGPYDVLDEGRILYLKRAEEEGDITYLNVVLNFFDELRERVPTSTP